MNLKNILIVSGSIIATFVLLFIIYKFTNTPVVTDFPELKITKITDHKKWNTQSKNILIEYSDFECPACTSFHTFLKEIEKTATPDAQLVFRHFPLYQIHPESLNAAYAVEAASTQGKFWEMSDLLFDNQTEWSKLAQPEPYFINLAKKLSLDLDKFKKDIASQAVKDRVKNDLSEGEKIGINSTPSFFLNGKKVEVKNTEELKTLLKNI